MPKKYLDVTGLGHLISFFKTLAAEKQNTLTFDSVLTDNSVNPVTSGAVYDAIGDADTIIAAINTLIGGLT